MAKTRTFNKANSIREKRKAAKSILFLHHGVLMTVEEVKSYNLGNSKA